MNEQMEALCKAQGVDFNELYQAVALNAANPNSPRKCSILDKDWAILKAALEIAGGM